MVEFDEYHGLKMIGGLDATVEMFNRTEGKGGRRAAWDLYLRAAPVFELSPLPPPSQHYSVLQQSTNEIGFPAMIFHPDLRFSLTSTQKPPGGCPEVSNPRPAFDS
jgi:hypothetical protein